jgi:trimeric autotransporter adhesin
MTSTIIRSLFFLLILCAFLTPPVSSITLSPGNSFENAPTIANGDPVFIRGVATGDPRGGLQVWVLGHNYVKISSVSVNTDDTYEFELKSADTQNLASGQYYVLIQHPMMNGEFDIYYDRESGSVVNRQLGGGTSIFQLNGPGSLQTPDSAYALMRAIYNQNTDDTFATASFIIGNPVARIDTIGDHIVGDKFTITGSTNLAVGNDLLIEIVSSSFSPTQKSEGSEFSGSSGIVNVEPGINGLNRWSFDVDSSSFKPDEYIVKVSSVTNDVTSSTTFNIIEKMTTTLVTPSPTTLPTASPVIVPASLTPTTTQKSPVSIVTILLAFVVAGSALLLKRK